MGLPLGLDTSLLQRSTRSLMKQTGKWEKTGRVDGRKPLKATPELRMEAGTLELSGGMGSLHKNLLNGLNMLGCGWELVLVTF